MNKKTATVTWIKYNNYGTILQAYALQNILNANNIDNTILNDININSKPKHSKKVYRILKRVFSIYNLSLKTKYININHCRDKKFVEFKNDYLRISKPINIEKFSQVNNEYDTFICGSDQIWSPTDEIFNEYYYLGFVDNDKLKISYAPSTGLSKMPGNKKEKISKLINRINYISVREEQGANLLSELTDKNIEVVLDPTLLLDPSEWEKIITRKNNSTPYILCYFLGDKKWYREYSEKLSKIIDIEIIVLPTCYMDLKLGNYSSSGSGPIDFLTLMHNAKYILTDSFHGTIFSVLFNKQFIAFKRFDETDENCQNSRIYNLLKKLDLLDRFVGDECDDINLINKYINYNCVNKVLEKDRKKSLDFLLKSLNKM